MDVLGGVVAHRLDIEVLKNIQSLKEHRTLHPVRELVHFDALVGGHYRFFDVHLPVGEIVQRVESTLFLRAANELLSDVSSVETIVGGVDRLFPVGSAGKSLLLRGNELSQGLGEVRLAEDLSRPGRLALFTKVRQQDFPRVRPLFDVLLVPLNVVRGSLLDGIALGHLDRGLEDVLEAERSVLCQHDQEAARRVPGVIAAKGPYWGGYSMPLSLKKLGVAPLGATPRALIPMTFFCPGW